MVLASEVFCSLGYECVQFVTGAKLMNSHLLSQAQLLVIIYVHVLK